MDKYFNSLENKNNFLEPPILAFFFQYGPEEVGVFINFIT